MAQADADLQLANRLRVAIQAMNVALREANDAGLHVQLKSSTYQTIGRDPTCELYWAYIERREIIL